MQFNSYGYDPSQDDDIFEDTDLSKDSSDIDEAAKRIHRDLTDGSYTHSVNVDHDTDPYVSIVGGFIEFLSDTEGASNVSPAVRAIMYCVNELTDGKATKMWRIFCLEDDIITTRSSLGSALKASRMIQDGNHEFFDFIEGMGQNDMESIEHGVSYIIDFMSYRLNRLVDEYKVICEECGYTPNSSILKNQKLDPDLPSWEKKLIAVTASRLSKVIDDE